MIRSMIDDDLYKFSMGNAALRLFPNLYVRYHFTDRRANGRWTKAGLKEVKRRINAMRKLALTSKERQFCETSMPWINRSYWDYLAAYRYDPREVKVSLDRDHNLHFEI